MFRAYSNYWKLCLDFRGRTPRNIFWGIYLANTVLFALCGALPPLAGANLSLRLILFDAFVIVNLLPMAALLARRLNDAGFSGKRTVAFLFVTVSALPVLLALCFRRSLPQSVLLAPIGDADDEDEKENPTEFRSRYRKLRDWISKFLPWFNTIFPYCYSLYLAAKLVLKKGIFSINLALFLLTKLYLVIDLIFCGKSERKHDVIYRSFRIVKYVILFASVGISFTYWVQGHLTLFSFLLSIALYLYLIVSTIVRVILAARRSRRKKEIRTQK